MTQKERQMILILSFITGFLGAWFIFQFGSKLELLDLPNERSSHDGFVPKGGGIGILTIFVFCGITLGLDKSFWIPAMLLSLVSFAGDRMEIRPELRLTVQFGCSLVFLAGLFDPGQGGFIWLLALPLAVFITGTANFYNFMDGINGIAGITGVVGFFLLAVFGHATGADSNHTILASVMAFACAGFLPFNVPNARVFMGDIGSVLLGFVFACMVVLLSDTFLDFICLAAFLFPFYADELITMGIRIRNKESLKHPHRKHLYQLLANEYGLSHWKISVSYGAVQLVVGMAVFLLKNSGFFAIIFLLTICFVSFFIFSVIFRRKVQKNKFSGQSNEI